jgi:hypothetical protein
VKFFATSRSAKRIEKVPELNVVKFFATSRSAKRIEKVPELNVVKLERSEHSR